MNLKLEGKKAFISGSTQGIGFAIAQHLLAENAEVIINGRNTEKTKLAVQKLLAEFPNAKISGFVADFGKKEEVEELVQKTK